MENWQYELDRARSDGERAGYKKGVTVGYANGFKDAQRTTNRAEAFEIAAAIGYNTHIHDLLDVMEKYTQITRTQLLEELEAIHAVREASGIYVTNPNKHG